MFAEKSSLKILAMVALGVVFFGIYWFAVSWQFAALLIGALVFHEYGHIWAMQRCGMKVNGLYLIPFVGGAAVTKDRPPSQRAMVTIALMGPIFGFALAVVTAIAYVVTGSPFLKGATAWMALINLFNLLPTGPLDGGHVLRSIAYSVPRSIGQTIMFTGVVLGGYLALRFGHVIWILWIVALLAWMAYGDFTEGRPKRQRLHASLVSRRERLEGGSLSKARKLQLSLFFQTLSKVHLLAAKVKLPPDEELLIKVREIEEKLAEPPVLTPQEIPIAIGSHLVLASLLLLLFVYTGGWESVMPLTR